MHKLYFDTGVKAHNMYRKLMEHEEFFDGSLKNVFYVEKIPENGIFKYIIPAEKLESVQKQNPRTHFEKIVDGCFKGKYAAFIIIERGGKNE